MAEAFLHLLNLADVLLQSDLQARYKASNKLKSEKKDIQSKVT